MIKSILFVVVALFPACIFCQEIKSNEVDPFTNERTIETTFIPIKQGLTSGFGISYIAVNKNYYLNLIGYGNEATAIKNEDKLWFVLDDGSVVQFNDRAEVEYQDSQTKNVYIRHYFARLNDIETLKNKHVALVRIASPGNVLTNLKMSKKGSKALMKLNDIFFKEVNK